MTWFMWQLVADNIYIAYYIGPIVGLCVKGFEFNYNGYQYPSVIGLSLIASGN